MRTKALRLITALFLISLIMLPITAAGRDRDQSFVGGRTVIVRSYPYYWGYAGGWGWRDPFWGGYYAPYYYDNRGKIKIKDENKLDQVFLNGAYAGTVEKMKTIRLDPGRYNVEIRQLGKSLVERQVYVVTGKTVEIHVNGE